MWLKKFFDALFTPGANPHFRIIVEHCRVTSPLGKSDAVLVAEGSSNFLLYIVPKGRDLYGRSHLLVFIHCDWPEPQITWRNESTILCVHACKTIANNRDIYITTEGNVTEIHLR